MSTKRFMVKALNAQTVRLTSEERPLDYGHCCQIMQDKYGQDRGLKMYESMIDSDNCGRFFVVASQIQREKKQLASILGKTGDWMSLSYEALYDEWRASVVS